jgi:hypothetical protein
MKTKGAKKCVDPTREEKDCFRRDVLQRKLVKREKYRRLGYMNNRADFFLAIPKAIFYVLGGPLVWIFWPAERDVLKDRKHRKK